ncbi:uncharacterized protein MEPE_02647 [Melanopsichium pennsylvanicum]|uniref:Uncharacterized protein n=1 Tax=Melanopsichium pennsylvanicum TaxID=63383 RepID=A0AAJ5C4X3_9BASI|nr:uncharacterized protein MEPE_02647 [Melanopsichium pennsylvanicum]
MDERNTTTAPNVRREQAFRAAVAIASGPRFRIAQFIVECCEFAIRAPWKKAATPKSSRETDRESEFINHGVAIRSWGYSVSRRKIQRSSGDYKRHRAAPTYALSLLILKSSGKRRKPFMRE